MRLTDRHLPPTRHARSSATRSAREDATGQARLPIRACALIGLLVLVLLASPPARADAAGVLAAPPASIDQVLTNLRNWLVGILAGLATLFLTVGGVRYVVAGGDLGEIEKAKSAFRGAGIGYGLAVLAPLVVSVLQGIVGG